MDLPMSQATEDLLTCSICWEHFINPKSLGCLHTFCLDCLKKLKEKHPNRITCPMCKAPTQVPASGIEALPSDFKIQQLKDIMQSRDSTTHPQGGASGRFCDVCKGKEGRSADVHCSKCLVFYCSVCVRKHQTNPNFRNHVVTTLPKDGRSFCKKHANHTVDFLCCTCPPTVTLCAVCMLDHDPKHHMRDLQEVLDSFRKDLREGLRKVETGKAQCAVNSKKIKVQCAKILKELQESIRKQAKRMIEEVHQMEVKKVNEAQEKIDRIMSQYDDQGKLGAELKRMEKLHREIVKTLRGPGELCLSSHKRLTDAVKRVENSKNSRLGLSVGLRFIPNNDSTLGSIVDYDIAASRADETVTTKTDAEPCLNDVYEVVADYIPVDSVEIPVSSGDQVEVLDADGGSWCYVRLLPTSNSYRKAGTNTGWIPSTYLGIGQAHRIDTHCVAMTDYHSVSEGDMSLAEGDVVQVLDVTNEGWEYVRFVRSGEEGWVPSSYLQPLQESDHDMTNPASYTTGTTGRETEASIESAETSV